MQLRIGIQHWVATLAAAVVFGFSYGAEAAPTGDEKDLTTLVSRVYERYAWVAVFSVKAPEGAVPLAQATRKELQEIFVPDLAQSIFDDAQCAAERQEICILDFDLLFDSQDPIASDLIVQAGPGDVESKVYFKDVSGAQRCLSFFGVRVGGLMKVKEIVYPGGRSLRQLLGLAL